MWGGGLWAEISGAPKAGFSSSQAIKALEEVAAGLPKELSIAWSNMSYQEKAAEGTGSTMFLMALVFVFLILAAQYESWKLPFSVLLGVPAAILGAYLGLWLGGFWSSSYVNNVFAQIGLVMLIGLTAKNAILIVEFAIHRMDQGLGLVEAAIEAAAPGVNDLTPQMVKLRDDLRARRQHYQNQKDQQTQLLASVLEKAQALTRLSQLEPVRVDYVREVVGCHNLLYFWR